MTPFLYGLALGLAVTYLAQYAAARVGDLVHVRIGRLNA